MCQKENVDETRGRRVEAEENLLGAAWEEDRCKKHGEQSLCIRWHGLMACGRGRNPQKAVERGKRIGDA